MRVVQLLCVAVAAAGLSGCSAAKLLGGGSPEPQAATNIPVGNQLALPPDLALAAPRQTVDSYQPNGPIASTVAAAPAQTELYSAGPKRNRNGSMDELLAYYNISKVNADGTPRPVAEINRDLRAALKADKRRTDPKYGTIFNIGNIFTDG